MYSISLSYDLNYDVILLVYKHIGQYYRYTLIMLMMMDHNTVHMQQTVNIDHDQLIIIVLAFHPLAISSLYTHH